MFLEPCFVFVSLLLRKSLNLLFLEAEGFSGDSWTVQCEIIQQNMLGERELGLHLVPK
jgi:hypothetical protein